MKNRIRCAVVGVGYLGKFHAEKYSKSPQAELVAICDLDRTRSQEIAAKYDVTAFTDYRNLVGKIEAVSIAVPTCLHFQIAKFFLEHDIHVLLEKPIARSKIEAEKLLQIADEKKMIFEIGHLERFNPVFAAIKPRIKNPVFIESLRLAPFKKRGTDVNVIIDLMIHDLDLIQSIVSAPIKQIHARGFPVLSDKIDIANAYIEFADDSIVNLTASRISLKTQRKMRVFQLDAYFSCDFHEQTLSIFGKGDAKFGDKISEINAEKIVFPVSDALNEEISFFLQAIANKDFSLSSAKAAKGALITALDVTHLVEQNIRKLTRC